LTENFPLPNLIYGVAKSISIPAPAPLSDSFVVPSAFTIFLGKPLSSKLFSDQ